jgi:hypothetical protein
MNPLSGRACAPTPAAKSDEYLNLMRTVAIPDYRSTAGNKALTRCKPLTEGHSISPREANRGGKLTQEHG